MTKTSRRGIVKGGSVDGQLESEHSSGRGEHPPVASWRGTGNGGPHSTRGG